MPDTVTIVALGDSTTAGTPGFRSPLEAPPDGSGDETSQYAYWLMWLQPSWCVLNRGVNGERADQIRARFARDVVSAAPQAAIVIAGVNDIYQGRSAAAVQRELEALYVAARAAGIPVVAGSIVPYNSSGADANARMHEVNAWIREYAEAHPRDVIFCDTRAAVAAPGAPDRLASSPDDLHPSPDGYRRMATALEPAVARALSRE
ncbi:MAG TPA: GDSL-type esterase/lipase family protein [Vicinamibacterales bacterium]|nr:GDSL-type esterase/lipase family protein [Vicinamibacterales bacterium]